jgi:uncharacterized Fe-S center protein
MSPIEKGLMKSNVYFAKLEAADLKKRISALKKILQGCEDLLEYRKNELVPVKVTIGEPACIYNVSPELAKTVIREIKTKQAKPFLFDTSVIYKGERQNAVDHLNLAQSKGFGPAEAGAPFIIADGLLGQDGNEYAIKAEHIEKIKVPAFVGMLDSLVVLSHVTGHIVSGYAAAIKNVAMGMACRPTKQVQHSSLKPSIIAKKCTACGCCIKICPVNAISFKDEKAFIEQKICLGCGECICACKFDAVYINWHGDKHIFCKRMVEVANFVLSKFKQKFYLNFAFNITKECDCISTKDDRMISGDLGIFASADIVSLDKATADMAYQHKKTDFLKDAKKIYAGMLDYAAKKGLGSLEYNLVDL